MDAGLLLITCIWGSNYSVVKFVLQELSPRSFASLRLALASLVFLVMIRLTGRTVAARPFSRRDLALLGLLACVGHFLYQTCFIEGIARTSAANVALIMASTPVAVALTSAALGHERVGRLHWCGAALSVLGVYLVVGWGARASGSSIVGDLLVLTAVGCWTIYTVAAAPLLVRHSPLVVTGYSMAIGTVLFLVCSSTALASTPWRAVSNVSWVASIFSSLLALNLAYTVWYTGVQRLGASRTAIYSNMVPIAALVVAWLWLGEPIGWLRITGAGLVLGGVALTRA